MRAATTGTRLGILAAAGTLAALAATAGAANARAAGSCGLLTASGHPWIVVASNVPCPTATRVVRALAPRTAKLRNGDRVTVRSPVAGFVCVLASRGKPAGSCSTVGARKMITWIAAV